MEELFLNLLAENLTGIGTLLESSFVTSLQIWRGYPLAGRRLVLCLIRYERHNRYFSTLLSRTKTVRLLRKTSKS